MSKTSKQLKGDLQQLEPLLGAAQGTFLFFRQTEEMNSTIMAQDYTLNLPTSRLWEKMKIS